MRVSGGPVGLCELCFQGASDGTIAARATEIPAGPLEAELLGRVGSRYRVRRRYHRGSGATALV